MTITGSIEEIRFVNEENGFHILVLDVGGEPIVTVGTFPPVSEGEVLTLTGEFVVHPKFGKQFKCRSVQKKSPTTRDGIFRFLSSGLIKGIGPKTAERIIKTFGEKSLEVLELCPQKLATIRGISPKKAHQFGEEYKKHMVAQHAIMFLQSKGISLNFALKIFKVYGTQTQAAVSSNPYRLIEDIDGIGFITADRIAKELGIEHNSEFRVRAGIVWTLKESGDKNGNTFLFKEQLIDSVATRLSINDKNLISDVVEQLVLANKLKVIDIDGEQAVFLRYAYGAELGAATKLCSLINNFNKSENYDDIISDLNEYRKIYRIQLNDQQKDAVIKALSGGLTIITGGPGTGKTTVIKCLIYMFKKRRQSYMLMAPTGRAAKRITESTDQEASTIHRALKLPVFSEDMLSQLDTDNVIIDEVSMMDIYLFNVLLKCLKDGTRLILLGDKDQLPSVGAGNVLGDLLKKMPSVWLTQVYRQAEESLIISNAHLINNGYMPVLSNNSKDFFFIRLKRPEDIASEVVSLVSRRLPNYLGVTPDKIQVLCPMKNGAAGAKNLNELLSAALNSAKSKAIFVAGTSFKEGDKVMQTTNNYNLAWTRGSEKGEGVYNGDMGFIQSVHPSTHELVVLFDDGRRVVYSENIDELIKAYAITVHKSQGSEFEAVVIPLVSGSPQVLTKNLLYTAITRAKRLVVLVGEEYNIRRMVDNNYIALRNSALDYFIDKAKENYKKLFGQVL